MNARNATYATYETYPAMKKSFPICHNILSTLGYISAGGNVQSRIRTFGRTSRTSVRPVIDLAISYFRAAEGLI
jgi:hypothetical protein